MTSKVAAAGPIPGHGVSLSTSLPHIKPQLTKAAVGGIMRCAASFSYVWSVTFSFLLVFCVDTTGLCARTWPDGPHRLPPFRRWPLKAASKPCEFLRSRVRAVYTSTQKEMRDILARPSLPKTSSRHVIISCVSRKKKKQSAIQNINQSTH